MLRFLSSHRPYALWFTRDLAQNSCQVFPHVVTSVKSDRPLKECTSSLLLHVTLIKISVCLTLFFNFTTRTSLWKIEDNNGQIQQLSGETLKRIWLYIHTHLEGLREKSRPAKQIEDYTRNVEKISRKIEKKRKVYQILSPPIKFSFEVPHIQQEITSRENDCSRNSGLWNFIPILI